MFSNHSRIVALLFGVFMLLTSTAWAKPPTLPSNFEAKVCEVGDGDTLHVCFNGGKAKVRLIGIEAPEYHEGDLDNSQIYGKEARDALVTLVLNKLVKVSVVELDQHKRPLVVIFLGKTHVNQTLVEKGQAYAYTGRGAPKDTDVYRALERQAKEAERGFWGLPDNLRPEYPGKWKKRRR